MKTQRYKKLGLACLILSMMASIFVVLPAVNASAQTTKCKELSKSSGNVLSGGSAKCQYVVMSTSDWSRVCDIPGGNFCGVVPNGNYRVDVYLRSGGPKQFSHDIRVRVSGGSACSGVSVATNATGFSAGNPICYYVVTNMSNWRKVCEGVGGSDGLDPCDRLSKGRYKVDVYNTSPWSKNSSDVITIR